MNATTTTFFANRTTTIITALLLSLLLSMFQAAQAAPLNGRTVNVVEFGDSSGKLGTFRQVSHKQWIEQNKQGQRTFSFRETHRDAWSVYLLDSSRQVRLQLDMHRKVVGYSDPQSPHRDQYRILSGSAKLSGWLAKQVYFQGGAFVQAGGKAWKELRMPSRTVAFNFREVARDDWSVYLHDASRNVNIQLDLHTRKVMYSEGNRARRPIYNIATAK